MAATTLAARVAEEKNTHLGNTVGYSIRFDECFDRDRTKIKYMTEGILVREMLGDPLLKSYSVLMLDEVSCAMRSLRSVTLIWLTQGGASCVCT